MQRGTVTLSDCPSQVIMSVDSESPLDDAEVDEETNNRLLRRIDLFMMPIMCFVYGLNFLDKVTLSFASIMGIKLPPSSNPLSSGIDLTGLQYSWLGSLFFFGYFFAEWPMNWLLQRFPLAKFSAFNIFAWGVIMTCHAALFNFAGAAVLRTLLGVFEAAVTPGFAIITSRWYRQEEQGLRTAIWYSANGLMQIFGSVLAWGILHASKKYGVSIEPWRILFLVVGGVTIVTAVIFIMIVPDSERNAWWLSKSDRALAVRRTRKNWQDVSDRSWKVYQLKEAVLDPMTWALCLAALFFSIPPGGLTLFFSQIIVGLGFTAEDALLYGAPAGATGGLTILLSGYLSRKYPKRILWGILGLTIALVGILLMLVLPDSRPYGKLVGYYLTPVSLTAFSMLLSLLSSNVAGNTKKATVAALFLIFFCIGSLIGPQLFRAQDAPHYVPGLSVSFACWCLTIIDLLFIKWYYTRQMAQKAIQRERPDYVKPDNYYLDRTDRENPEFVYML